MATLVQIGEATESLSERPPMIGNELHVAPHIFHLIAKTFLGTILLPFFLAVALVVFLVALGDFAWFRLRDLRNGHPRPKGLWEF
ncbi:MAG: hypothetical protein WBY53_10090 [Acidobacteriaceae bacterium]